MSFDYALDASTNLFLGNSTDILGLQSEANNEGACSSKALNEATPWLATRECFKMFAGLVTILGLLRSCRTARDSLENITSRPGGTRRSPVRGLTMAAADSSEPTRPSRSVSNWTVVANRLY